MKTFGRYGRPEAKEIFLGDAARVGTVFAHAAGAGTRAARHLGAEGHGPSRGSRRHGRRVPCLWGGHDSGLRSKRGGAVVAHIRSPARAAVTCVSFVVVLRIADAGDIWAVGVADARACMR